MPVYQFIRGNGEWDNWKMVPIETRACENRLDALKIERGHIERLNATLNAYRPHRTNDERLQQMREHYQNNPEITAKLLKLNNITITPVSSEKPTKKCVVTWDEPYKEQEPVDPVTQLLNAIQDPIIRDKMTARYVKLLLEKQ